MISGSFEGLYTFSEVGEIYGFDASSLRKQVACEKLIEGKDIKKFGKTWVITEESMVKKFGTLKFEDFQKKKIREEISMKKKMDAQMSKVKKPRSDKNVGSMDCKEEKVNEGWVDDIKGIEVKSFSFNTNNSE
ncbi:MAG: helix-turn-helix domain-containing protein [Peptostreptococcaceae bacterium]